jgi:hypothetical protein
MSLANSSFDSEQNCLLFPSARSVTQALQPLLGRFTISSMKIFVSLLVTTGILFGVYILYLKRLPTAAEGTVATQAISLTGVKMDLQQIAKAERNSIGVDGHCMSMEELLASGSMSLSRPERDGYSYTVECSGTDFTVTARHAPAPAGSGLRYPSMMIDQSMQTREVE